MRRKYLFLEFHILKFVNADNLYTPEDPGGDFPMKRTPQTGSLPDLAALYAKLFDDEPPTRGPKNVSSVHIDAREVLSSSPATLSVTNEHSEDFFKHYTLLERGGGEQYHQILDSKTLKNAVSTERCAHFNVSNQRISIVEVGTITFVNPEG